MIHEAYQRFYHFEELPKFAAYLLLQHLDAYTTEFIRLGHEVDLPLRRHLSHLSEEELFQFSKGLHVEFLTNLSQNKAQEHLETITHRWLSGGVQNIGKLDVEAQDITLINYVRGKTQKMFITRYTMDPDQMAKLHSEIDDLNFIYSTTSINNYLKVLKDRIVEEANFSANLIDASPGLIFIYDILQGKEVYINGKVEELMGYTPEEILNIPDLIPQLTHPQDVPVVLDFMQRVIAHSDKRTQQAEYRLRNKNGAYQWLRCYAVVYKRDEAGAATQILGAAYEITNEKETAFSLIKRERQLLEAQAIGQIGSFEWDLQKDESVSTPELRKIFEADTRQTLEELLQKVHPEDRETLTSALAEAFTSGDFRCEFRYQAPSEEKVIDSRGVVYFDEEQKPLTLVGTIQDITQRKKVEERLLHQTLELERSNEHLQEFAYIASHDLKEPLRKIGMFSNIIMTSDWDELPEKTKTNLQKISEAAARMQQLIEGILTYSTLTAGVKKERCSLQHLLEEALNNLESRIESTGAQITSFGLPEAEVVPFQMQQLFQNLIGNALKFSKKDVPPRVEVSHMILPKEAVKGKTLQEAPYYLQITISDNGIGFNEIAKEKIFGLFQRLHSRHEFEGSGLGLAICKKIVENHGGTIRAESKEGVGSLFTILLPVSK